MYPFVIPAALYGWYRLCRDRRRLALRGSEEPLRDGGMLILVWMFAAIINTTMVGAVVNRNNILYYPWILCAAYALWQMGRRLKTALAAMVVMVALGPELLRLLIGTSNAELLRYGTMSLRASAALFLPLAYLVTMRQAMQALGMRVVPVVSSCIELMKIAAAFVVVPRFGYAGACWVEPATWLACCVFLMMQYMVKRKEILHL